LHPSWSRICGARCGLYASGRLMKGVVKIFDLSSLEKKPPEGDSEQVEELLDVTG